MAKHKIEHQKELCIGCGACAAINPDDWEMEGDKSHLKGSEKEKGPNGEQEFKVIEEAELSKNQEAADSCPVPCIFIKKVEE